MLPTSDYSAQADSGTVETDLIVVGAGAKAAAIATKVHVLNSLGLGPVTLTILEAVVYGIIHEDSTREQANQALGIVQH